MGRSYNYETTEILRVIDGDTVVASVDLGFETFRKMNIRLKGIDAPELRNFHTRIQFRVCILQRTRSMKACPSKAV